MRTLKRKSCSSPVAAASQLICPRRNPRRAGIVVCRHGCGTRGAAVRGCRVWGAEFLTTRPRRQKIGPPRIDAAAFPATGPTWNRSTAGVRLKAFWAVAPSPARIVLGHSPYKPLRISREQVHSASPLARSRRAKHARQSRRNKTVDTGLFARTTAIPREIVQSSANVGKFTATC